MMTEIMLSEHLPMDERIEKQETDYYSVNFGQRNEALKKQLCFAKKVVIDG